MGSIGHPCSTIKGSARHLSLMTVQALREVSICDEASPTTHAVQFKLSSSCSSITLLDQRSLSHAWIECGNKTLFSLHPTASIDKAFLVISMQFSIGKMIKRRQNSITLCPIDRTDYHFRNRWA